MLDIEDLSHGFIIGLRAAFQSYVKGEGVLFYVSAIVFNYIF